MRLFAIGQNKARTAIAFLKQNHFSFTIGTWQEEHGLFIFAHPINRVWNIFVVSRTGREAILLLENTSKVETFA